ncbi:MAG: vWA domain-containing protein [Planctomycetota bacterium]
MYSQFAFGRAGTIAAPGLAFARQLRTGTALGLALLLSGCGAMVGVPVDTGVTTGGQQDIASARTIIERGGVPDPDSVTVEGFLSEHSIPVEQPEDAGELFAAVATGWNDDFDAFTPLATVQLGFGTNIDSASFERKPLNLALVVDTSGSMGDSADGRNGTSKLEAVRIAIDRLLGNLNEDDIVSIVTFNSLALTRLEGASGNDVTAIKSELESLVPSGSTDLARGMRSAYRVVDRNRITSRDNRLIVFTDVLLTARPSSQADELISVMEEYAVEDIGATLFGIGTDLGHETARRIAQVRGGNYFFLSDYERIVTVFDDEFDLLVTPVAYDVTFTINVPFEFDVEGVYGIPAPDPLPHVLELKIPTLFLSNRQGGGATLIRLRAGSLVDFEVENVIAEVLLSYTDREGEPIELDVLEAKLPAGLDPLARERYFETPSVQRAVLLLNTALVLKASLQDAYPFFGAFFDSDSQQSAIDRISAFLPYFDDLAGGLEDRVSETSRGLSEERTLLDQLRLNIFGE